MGNDVGRCWLCAALFAAGTAVGPGSTQAQGASDNVRLAHIVHRAAVARALEGAARDLQRPECQALLDDFANSSGRSLRASLAAFGVSAPEYLLHLFFYEADERACTPSVLALTTPGSRAILVCGARFERQMGLDSRHAEAILIHEALHSLGLGENPPSSDYITKRIWARCGQR